MATRIYRVISLEGGIRERAGTLRQTVYGSWVLQFKNGFQYYCHYCEGTFDECMESLKAELKGVLEPYGFTAKDRETEERIRRSYDGYTNSSDTIFV